MDVDEDYVAADRFEDDKNKEQGQLRDIIDLIQEKFQVQALRWRWFRRQVGYVHILQFYTYSLIGCEWP
jgi:C-terminal processing protease CtpA/Prc